MKSFSRLFVLGMGLTMFGQTAIAAEVVAPAGAPMVDEKAAMMAKAKAAMSPNENHKALQTLAGKWNAVSKFWMSPEAPPEESAGTSATEMVYGGRFLKETFKGTWQGEPFEGTGYTGYDNVKQEYQSVWIDGASTSIMNSTGAYDAATKTFRFSGTVSCPITGQRDMKMRMEHVIIDNDHHTLTGWNTGTDGQEIKGMEIAYTRA